ncbi:phenylalanine--tRNA ligase subunit alpha [Candidatus Woesearchaeota archaeon]|nr:phenylalanine--tRNA ligase subunit alpha [Candidatus Woesearchaeota archaeon]
MNKSGLHLLVSSLHPLERKLLPHLKQGASVEELCAASGMQEVEVIRAIQWLSNKDILQITSKDVESIELDQNGKAYLQKGLPERRFLTYLARQKKPVPLHDLEQHASLDPTEIQACIGILKRKNSISFLPDKTIKMTKEGETFLSTESPEERILKDIHQGKAVAVSECKGLLQRKNLITVVIKKKREISLTKLGQELAKEDITGINVIDRLTPTIIQEKTWEGRPFRRYDVKINVPPISGGRRHFVNQATDYIKQIWLDLGFVEMTGNMAQTAFWDLDALFVPQDHPARAMQDTFYLGEKTPVYGDLPAAYRDIKTVHESGGNTGSRGWQAPWNEEEARRVLLRTHTTVLSAQTLAKLKKEDLPAKFFNVGRVFRNEALDWKHLFEFHQVDGIVIDPDANLKHLKGYLKLFFRKMGYPDARIRPAHFPYTEPSCEVDVWHPVHKQWIELGGAGIFRPEVVVPLLGIDVPVLAWGLGLERIISEYYQFTDLRELYGNDIKKLREIPLWMR